MKKYYTVAVVPIFAALIIALFTMTACSYQNFFYNSRYINSIKKNWGISLPMSMKLIYRYSNVGWFGDGEYFYIYDTELSNLSVEFDMPNDVVRDKVDDVFNEFLQEVPLDYRIDWKHDCVYYYLLENDGRDFIYLIYDNVLSRLSILESHS